MMVRKFSMLASRAELSQHTLVTVPVISAVSKPRPRSRSAKSEAGQKAAVAVFQDDFVFRPQIELRPQFVSAGPLRERPYALYAPLRSKHLERHGPLAEASLVMDHLDPEHP